MNDRDLQDPARVPKTVAYLAISVNLKDDGTVTAYMTRLDPRSGRVAPEHLYDAFTLDEGARAPWNELVAAVAYQEAIMAAQGHPE